MAEGGEEMTSKLISNSIIKDLADRQFPIYLTNYQNGGFSEADVFGITKAGLMYEFEIKISKSDYLADFKNKTHKHNLLSRRDAIHTYSKWVKGKRTDQTYDVICLPNRFYYACPEKLISANEIPEYAGLVYMTENGTLIEIKTAPILHHHKANEAIYKNISAILSERYVWGCAYRTYKFKTR